MVLKQRKALKGKSFKQQKEFSKDKSSKQQKGYQMKKNRHENLPKLSDLL